MTTPAATTAAIEPTVNHPMGALLDGEELAQQAHGDQASELDSQEQIGDELNQACEHTEALAQDGAHEVRRGSRLRRVPTQPG